MQWTAAESDVGVNTNLVEIIHYRHRATGMHTHVANCCRMWCWSFFARKQFNKQQALDPSLIKNETFLPARVIRYKVIWPSLFRWWHHDQNLIGLWPQHPSLSADIVIIITWHPSLVWTQAQEAAIRDTEIPTSCLAGGKAVPSTPIISIICQRHVSPILEYHSTGAPG
jgi:hypothetical protein